MGKQTTDPVLLFQSRIGYRFSDPSLAKRALTRPNQLGHGEDKWNSYQRLEFLGDRVLNLIIADILYRDFPTDSEGMLSKRLAQLVCEKSCAEIAHDLGIQEILSISNKNVALQDREIQSTLADICEAMIGAIYQDAGFQETYRFVHEHWKKYLFQSINSLNDAKTQLQEWAQKRGFEIPIYQQVDRTGKDHAPVFRISVTLPGFEKSEGIGTSKREAEQKAAALFLQREGIQHE